MPNLLVLDDEPDICEFIADVANGLGFTATTAIDITAFRCKYEDLQPDVIILDLMMPQTDGIEVLRGLGSSRCTAAIVLVSGADARVLRTAERLGTTYGLRMLGSLRKPLTVPELEELLGKVLREKPRPTVRELREAVERRELVVYFQPKAELTADGQWRVVGAEALVRWQHPRFGLVMPGNFIPLAEQSGLITMVTDLVLRDTIEQAAAWRRDGLSLEVSANIAAQVLSDLALPDRISGLLNDHELAPETLTLEITESAVMADAARTMDILTRFRLKGFGLSLDDFGTGYSSLVQLHRMPFSEMKIDRSFVTEIGQNEEVEKIIRSIVDLGHNIGLKLCAEGIETHHALQFLCGLGCEMGQGYLIGRPVPAAEFTEGLRAADGNPAASKKRSARSRKPRDAS